MPLIPALGALLAALTSTFIARALVGAGLGLATFFAVRGIVNNLLGILHDWMNGLPEALIAIISMSGVGDGLSMIGSAFIARAAMMAAKVFVEKTSA